MRKNGLLTEVSKLPLKFLDSGYRHGCSRNSVSVWHYNQQDRFVMKDSRYNRKY